MNKSKIAHLETMMDSKSTSSEANLESTAVGVENINNTSMPIAMSRPTSSANRETSSKFEVSKTFVAWCRMVQSVSLFLLAILTFWTFCIQELKALALPMAATIIMFSTIMLKAIKKYGIGRCVSIFDQSMDEPSEGESKP